MSLDESNALDRRCMITGAAALSAAAFSGLAGCATVASSPSRGGPSFVSPPLAKVRAETSRIFDITVCTRPFRAAGPRLNTEQIGDTLIVHNYGHGGSGWSLSWGSSSIAVGKAMSGSPTDVAVIGCGALGLTSAILAQRAGARVTIYARDLLPQARSARATGSWTPDSRIALATTASPDFGALWEQMARTSFKTYRNYLGLPGTPVEWTDRYFVSDISPEEERRQQAPEALEFGRYEGRIRDLDPFPTDAPAGSTPFVAPYIRKYASMQFNIADLGHTLMTDFFTAGGKFTRMEFHSPSEIAALKEKVVINCPGYAARALWKDETLTPVRGQIGWLIPQPEVDYGVLYKGVNMLSRRDGIVVQVVGGGDMRGYGDDTEKPDRAEAEGAVKTLAELFSRFRTVS